MNKTVFFTDDNETERTIFEKAEKAQQKGAQQLKAIVDNVSGGISAIIINDDGSSRLVMTNEKYFELYGYTKAEAESNHLDVMTLIAPEDLPLVMQKVKQLKADGIPTVIDYQINRRDGSRALLRANSALMHMDDYGDVITSVITDITKQRLFEDQLRSIVENICGGVTATYFKDGVPTFVVVNNQFFHLLGYQTREEYKAACGDDKFAGIHPDDKQRIIDQFSTADGGKTQYTMEYRVIRKDGELRYIRNTVRLIHLFGINEPVYLSVANDITDTVEAQKKLCCAMERLKAVMNIMEDGMTAVAFHNDHSKFLFANDKYYEMHGTQSGFFKWDNFAEALRFVHPDDRKKVQQTILSAAKTNKAASVEYRIFRADGKISWINAVINITTLSDIDVPVQVTVYTDITEMKESNDQLRFLNDTAHDILAQPESELAIKKLLEDTLTYFDGERSYIFEFHDETRTSDNTYEVCADGIHSKQANLQSIPFKVQRVWINAFRKVGFVAISNVATMSDREASMRTLLLSQNIHSLIVVPLWRGNMLTGYLGIDNPAKSVNQIVRLKALADYVTVLLTRRDLNEKIDSDRKMLVSLMNDTPGGFVRIKLDKSGSFVPLFSNEGFVKLVGKSHEKLHELYANDILAGVHPDDRDLLSESGTKMLRNGKAESARFRILNGDGGYTWLTMYGKTTEDNTGTTYLNIYFSDVTKEVSEEQKQKNLLDNLPCGAALYEYDGKDFSVIHINKSYWKLVEREPVDYSHTSVLNVIHPDDVAVVKTEINTAIRQNRSARASVRILCAKSGYKPFRIDANFTLQKNGKHLLFASYTPLSDRAIALREMLPVALSTMMSFSGDLSFIKDRQLLYISCSDSAATAMGFDDTNEVIGKSDFLLFDPENAELFIAQDREVFDSGKPILNCIQTIKRHDGTYITVNECKYPITDGSGEVIGIYGVCRDVTVQNEKETQLRLLTDKIPVGIVVCTHTGNRIRVNHCNNSFCELFGLEYDEVEQSTKSNPLSPIFEEDRHLLSAQYRRMVKNGTPIDCIYRIHSKKGGLRRVHHRAVLIDRYGNTIVVNAALFDVTEH